MDWIQLLVLVGTMLGTVLGIVIPLHLHTLSHLRAIADEMKDLHGRLERQDAEFRGRAEKIDAEFRGRAEKLDAEFKSHLMHLHGGK